MQKLLFVSGLLLLAVTSHAQKTLTGKVLDAINAKPIPLASVFLSNTSKGTATGEQGQFTLHHFPEGKFDVVISCMGYETYSQTIESNNIPDTFIVRLKLKISSMEEVVIGGYEELSWKEWGPFFLNNFIGTSEFAENCRIINPELIKLRRNKATRVITASAKGPLLIENSALGYNIHYVLEKFEYDARTKYLFFAGYPLFENIQSEKKNNLRRWEKNRQEAYSGSLLHFMRSLYRNILAAEQYEVRRLKKLPNQEKQRVKDAYKKNTQKKLDAEGKTRLVYNPPSPDSAAYYRRIMRQPDLNSFYGKDLLTGDSIAYATDSVTLMLAFTDHLYVVYNNKKEPSQYLEYMHSDRAATNTSSELRLTENELQVFYNGSFFPGTAIVYSGYWAWSEKIGNMLPFDYWPPSKAKEKDQ